MATALKEVSQKSYTFITLLTATLSLNPNLMAPLPLAFPDFLIYFLDNTSSGTKHSYSIG